MEIIKKLFLLIVIFSASLFAQSKDSVAVKNKELSQLRNDIVSLERELRSISSKEKESLNALQKISQQNLLLNKVINNLINEEKLKLNDIKGIENQIGIIEKRISLMREKYSNYLVWVYKNLGTSPFKYLLSSSSLNQAIMRIRYLQFISESNEKTIESLKTNRRELASLKSKLHTEYNDKEILVNQKRLEQGMLTEKEKDRRELISKMKKNQVIITEEIDEKRKAEIEIKNLITRLIEKERERKSKLLEKKAEGKPVIDYNYNYANLAEFGQLKGRLIWPIRDGKIVRKFGENRNERLNTVTLNYGIDINVKGDDYIYNVGEGIVSVIDYIPGFGTVLIITHKNEYRTVYGHIKDIKVREGDRVKGGDILGSISESLEGKILHFEIWNERNYQNPEVWLVRR
ncbi:MAG: peptidoglycan DD-metalloendopeptidase family protein [Melioribacteraceae bacterium]|nr:peptidoglycan DD-metalloendopeptidase family protein [Melioribacteraceae bacterium]